LKTAATILSGGRKSNTDASRLWEWTGRQFFDDEDHWGRDNEIGGLCQSVYNTANPIVGSLVDQGVTPEDLATLQNRIDLYNGTIGKSASALSANKAAGSLMDAEFEATDKLFENQLDALIVKFKSTQPEFYPKYVAARRTVENASSHNGKNSVNVSTGNDTPQSQ
jgi:hypothetical protein